MNWLDLGIIIFIIILIVIGIRQGLMNSVLSNFSFSVNCLISFFLSRPIKFIFNRVFGVGSAISSHYYDLLIQKEGFATNLLEISEENLHSTVNIAINNGDFNFVSKTMFKIFLNKNNLYETLHNSDHVSRTMADIISETYSSFFMTIIAFVTSLVLVFIVVSLFQLLSNKLRTVGSVKVVDSVLGAFYGIFRCFVILVIVCIAIKLLSAFSFMDSVVNYINDSFFGRLIYVQINDFINNYLSFSDIVSSLFNH